VGLEGASASVTLNVTERAKLLMPPDAPEPYRLASGAMHARPWFVSGNAIEQNGEWSTSWATEASAVVIAAVVIAAGAVRGGVHALCGYLALDDGQSPLRRDRGQAQSLPEDPGELTKHRVAARAGAPGRRSYGRRGPVTGNRVTARTGQSGWCARAPDSGLTRAAG